MPSKGTHCSPEHRAKISKANTGKHPSAETRAMMSERRKGKPLSPEHRARMIKSLKSPETRAKMSESHKGKQRGPANPKWKGGRTKTRGYMRLQNPAHPRADIHGYVLEHIIVWEETHRRVLPPSWVIHHVNGIKDDNRPENLLACPQGNHHYALLLQALKARIRHLEAENKRLKVQGKLWG